MSIENDINMTQIRQKNKDIFYPFMGNTKLRLGDSKINKNRILVDFFSRNLKNTNVAYQTNSSPNRV